MSRLIRWISCKQCLCKWRFEVHIYRIFLLACACLSHLSVLVFVAHSSSRNLRDSDNTQKKQIKTHLTPAEKLTTGKKSPSVLKFSNMPWTGCPLILKEMLGAPRSRQQLTTSSEVRMCWFMDATARGIRPVQDTHMHTVIWNMTQWVMLAQTTSLTQTKT